MIIEKQKKPDWWPRNPYPEKIFPMKDEEYVKIVPDPRTRTALSGCLGRGFWDGASAGLWDAFCGAVEDGEVILPDRIEAAIRWLNEKKSVNDWHMTSDLLQWALTGEKDQNTWTDEDFGLVPTKEGLEEEK